MTARRASSSSGATAGAARPSGASAAPLARGPARKRPRNADAGDPGPASVRPRARPHNSKRPPCDDARWNAKLADHRRRQLSVAKILDSTFGRLDECDPGLWSRQACWLLVGIIYERLATNEFEIDTPELVALAKALTEGRRQEPRSGETGPSKGPGRRGKPDAPEPGELPPHFGTLVRRIYGANFDPPRDDT